MSDSNNLTGGEQISSNSGTTLAPDNPEVSKNKKSKKTGIIVASCIGAVVLASAAVAAFAFYAKGGDYPTNHISSEASVYLQLNTDPSGEQKLSALNLIEKYPELKENKDFSEILEGNTLQNILQKIDSEGSFAWAGDKASIAVGDMTDLETGEMPPVVLFIESNDDAAAERELAQLVEKTKNENPSTITSYTIYGDGYVSIQTDGSDASLLNVDSGALSDDEDFKKLMKDKDGNVVSGWGNLNKLNSLQSGLGYNNPLTTVVDETLYPQMGSVKVPSETLNPDTPVSNDNVTVVPLPDEPMMTILPVPEEPDMTIMPFEGDDTTLNEGEPIPTEWLRTDDSQTSSEVVLDDPIMTTQGEAAPVVDVKGQFAFTLEIRDSGVDFTMDQTEVYVNDKLVPNAKGEDKAASLVNELNYESGIAALGVSGLGESLALSWEMVDPDATLLKDAGVIIESPDDFRKLFGETAAVSIASDGNENFKFALAIDGVDEEYFVSTLNNNGMTVEQIQQMLIEQNPESTFVVKDGRVYLQFGPAPDGNGKLDHGQVTGFVNLDNMPGLAEDKYGAITFKVNADGDWTKSTVSWNSSR